MNDHPYTLLKTVIQNNREAIPFILAYVYLDLDAVHPQLENIKQNIQDATFYYLVNTHIPENNLIYTADYTIKYIKEFLHPIHSYSESQMTQVMS